VAGTPIAQISKYQDVRRRLTAALVATFHRENIHLLVVENGTIPDNPLFTEALWCAIAEYGAERRMGRYVLWRDHDMMWSALPHLYGPYPYPGVRRPECSDYIQYAVTTEWMRQRMLAWAPSPSYHVLPYRFYPVEPVGLERSFRKAFGIPCDAYLVARCTRIIPAKSIERDLRLFHEVQLRLAAAGDHRKVFLVVSGPTREHPDECARLRALEQKLSIAGQVVWADGLLALSRVRASPMRHMGRFSVHELLVEADLSSFLTTYDYEGFGMPPGEAMAIGVPFISTTYELYHEVYGNRGAVAPLWPIDRRTRPDDPIPEPFIGWTLRTLTNPEYRAELIRRNLEVARRYFSMDALALELRDLFGDDVATGGTHAPPAIPVTGRS
jgi:hypothetical protein